ncbi:MAG TPA: hypothetical protein VGL94_00830 [Ktedonobacteraceae bacterium]
MAKRKRRAHGEGGLVRRKDGRWAGSFYNIEGKRVYVYGNTQQEALEKLRSVQE